MAEIPPNLRNEHPAERHLRWLCYAYIVLLLIEGALRKWVLPGLSDALLVVRDPIVLLAYAIAFAHGRFPTNVYVVAGGLITVLMAAITMNFLHGDLFVTLFGIRTNFLHIPFAFIMGMVLDRRDVVMIGKWWLWGTLLMTVIITMQFYSPQSAWINKGVGGIEGGGFSGALGRYRPPGTFSFIVGTAQFYAVSCAFLVCALTQHKLYGKTLMVLASAALLIAIPVSISRQLILACILTLGVGLFTATIQKEAIIRIIRIGLFGVIGFFVVLQLPVFHDAKEAFITRWERSTGEDKGGIEEAIFGRIFKMFYDPLTETDELPLLGYGIGAGTQVGAKLMTGEVGFTLGESEWDRIMGEGGIAFGIAFCFWRVALAFKLFMLSLGELNGGNGMGLIFLSTAAFNIITGQLGQTTVNGFTCLGIGLTIAAMQKRKIPENAEDTKSDVQRKT